MGKLHHLLGSSRERATPVEPLDGFGCTVEISRVYPDADAFLHELAQSVVRRLELLATRSPTAVKVPRTFCDKRPVWRHRLLLQLQTPCAAPALKRRGPASEPPDRPGFVSARSFF